ncbi:MAG: DUF2785 domain-containing protein [Actinocatenispora sp.]
MISWQELVDADFAVPSDRDTAVDDLVTMLAAADPTARDGYAYRILTTWIRRGVLDDRLGPLGDAMTARFDHPEVQARTFAPLVLASAVARDTAAGVLDAARIASWRDRFAAWWPTEAEVRGWDPALGWLHAVAHGADLVGQLAESPRLDGDDLAALLRLVAARIVAPGGYRYGHMEEDRVGAAVGRVLCRPELTGAGSVGWLTTVDGLLATGEPGPLPVEVANTMAVLRAVYVFADRLPVPHRTVVLDAVADRLHEYFGPYPGRE